jgi:hypothetical protein
VARIATPQCAREHPPPDRQPALHVRHRQQDRELVATDPERAVTAAEDRAGDAPHGREELIAGRVSAFVVGLLEIVDVDEQQRELRAVASRTLELTRELLLEGTVVAQSGEAVEQRVEPCPAVHLEQHVPLGLERGGACERAASEERDRHGQDRADAQQHQQRPAAAEPRLGPQGGHRGDAHEHGELDDERPDQQTSNRL